MMHHPANTEFHYYLSVQSPYYYNKVTLRIVYIGYFKWLEVLKENLLFQNNKIFKIF